MKKFYFIILTLLIGCGSTKKDPLPEAPEKAINISLPHIDNLISAANFASQEFIQYEEFIKQAVERIITGGEIWVEGNPGAISEFAHRTGGMMMIRKLKGKVPANDDLVLFFPKKEDDSLPSNLKKTRALTFKFYNFCDQTEVNCISTKITNYKLPLMIGQVLFGNMFLAEMIGGFTRLKRMPVIYESLGRYDGFKRIQKYKNGKIKFHPNRSPEPLKFGKISAQYYLDLQHALTRVKRHQAQTIFNAKERVKYTQKYHHKTFIYYMGHMMPYFIKQTVPKKWVKEVYMTGYTKNRAPLHLYHEDDLIIYVGSHFSPMKILEKAKKRKARGIYLSLHQDRRLRDLIYKNRFIWIDPEWEWSEAETYLPGYDVPVIANSSLINAAILLEILPKP